LAFLALKYSPPNAPAVAKSSTSTIDTTTIPVFLPGLKLLTKRILE
jgi:hypothetical protein